MLNTTSTIPSFHLRDRFCHGPTGSTLGPINVVRNDGGFKNHIYDGIVLPNREAVRETALPCIAAGALGIILYPFIFYTESTPYSSRQFCSER